MTDTEVQDFLEHHGIKGQRWGIRRKRDSSDESKASNKRKTIAIVLGSVAAVGAIAAGSIYIKKRMNVRMSNVPHSSKTITDFAKSMAHEPIDIAHSSRGFDRGYTFLRDGGLKLPNAEFAKAGLAEAHDGFFKRFGDNGEKIAARFTDPEGRKDFSGRIIGHDVILPKSMSNDVHNIDDVVKKVWPHVKDIYGAFYKSKTGTLGPGF